MNTIGISSNALFGIQLTTSLNLSLDAKLLSKSDLLCWLGYHFVFFVYAKITLNTGTQCADVNIGGRK